jgi:hypothetical protein
MNLLETAKDLQAETRALALLAETVNRRSVEFKMALDSECPGMYDRYLESVSDGKNGNLYEYVANELENEI